MNVVATVAANRIQYVVGLLGLIGGFVNTRRTTRWSFLLRKAVSFICSSLESSLRNVCLVSCGILRK